MIIVSDYNNGVDEVWYASSTIVYTRFVENESDNNGQLYVTFKGGSTYHYIDVNMPIHYLAFKHGMNESSAGKSLNAYIKPNYQFEKVSDVSIDELERRRKDLLVLKDKDNTYFISGHGDITEDEFDLCYAPALLRAADNPDSRFVVGDFHGVDIMAQNYLVDILALDPARITVYHMYDSPRNKNEKITNTVGGFNDDESRDSAMTNASFQDIAFIRKGKEKSCTAMNILRRYIM